MGVEVLIGSITVFVCLCVGGFGCNCVGCVGVIVCDVGRSV